MSKPKKNQEKEPAIKAGPEKAPKKPVEKVLTEINKSDPLKQFCAHIEESDFEGTIEFTEKDIDALTPVGDGRNLFEFYQFDAPEEFEDWAYLQLPIMKNELAKEYNVYVMLIVPYLFKAPLLDALNDPRVTDDLPCIVLGDAFFAVTKETLEQYDKALNYIGFDSEITQVENNESFKELVEALKKAQIRENGYYEDLMEYWYAGHIFHEKDVIWVDLESMAEDDEKEADVKENQIVGCRTLGNPPMFVLNFDSLGDIHSPMDVSDVKKLKVKNYRRVLTNQEIFEAKLYGQNLDFLETLTPNEEVWYLATKKAEEEESAGFAVVCLRGKFYVPVETEINYYTHEVEEYISLFNVASCYPNHHKCIGMIVADVGNMQVYTGVRYLKGRHFDWRKRIEQEIEAYRLTDPDYFPFDDPYDSSDTEPFDDWDNF